MAEPLGKQIKTSKSKLIMSLVFILLIGILSNYIYCLAVYVGPLSEYHGWSANSIVLAYSLAMFFAIPSFMVGQVFANKFGLKRVLVASGVLYGLAILFSGIATNVWVFVICQGVIGSIAMYGILICTIAIVNVLFPSRKGLVMGLLYGSQAVGAAALAPVATVFISMFNVSMALIIQGIIFTIILFVCCMLISNPSENENAIDDNEEVDLDRPSMTWKSMLKNPGFYFLVVSIFAIQMIGNVLVTDAAYLAEGVYEATPAQAAYGVSLFSIGAGVGGVVIGFISDHIGPFRSTAFIGIIDGVLLAILAMIGTENYTVFLIMLVIQGFTYNGITTLNPVMATDAFGQRDIGICIGFTAIGTMAVGFIGPQFGLSVSFVPMIIICAVLSVVGGVFALFSRNSFNSYYKKIESNVVIK